jgi:hypothetical protein
LSVELETELINPGEPTKAREGGAVTVRSFAEEVLVERVAKWHLETASGVAGERLGKANPVTGLESPRHA